MITNQASDSRRSRPNCAMLLKIRQSTAYGANFIMMSMIFDVIAKTDSMTPTNGADTGAGISVIAMPMIKAKNMMCSMFGLVPEMELKTFLGTRVFSACINGESEFAEAAADRKSPRQNAGELVGSEAG